MSKIFSTFFILFVTFQLTTLGDKGRLGKSIGSAATPVSAPVPMNTPSLRRENKGKDVSVNLVPTGNAQGVWGGSSSEPKVDGYQAVAGSPPAGGKPVAPWIKSDGGGDQSLGPTPSGAAKAGLSKKWADEDSDEENENSGRNRTLRGTSGNIQGNAGDFANGNAGYQGDSSNVIDNIRARSYVDYNGVEGRYGRPDDTVSVFLYIVIFI